MTDLGTKDKSQLKPDCNDGCVLNGSKKPIFYSFVLIKPPRYKIFCSLETILFKKN